VPRDEHNGEGFHYRVAYRPLGSREQISTSQVTTPTSSQLIVYDVPVFQKYEIFVQSVNRIGEAPILGGERKVGYSGEGRKYCTSSLFIRLFINTHKAAVIIKYTQDRTTENIQNKNKNKSSNKSSTNRSYSQ